jgi:hypothetical protein
MVALSVADQEVAIRRLFPSFRQVCDFDFLGIWRGPLRPIARTYEIGIAYCPRVLFAGGAIIDNPYCSVRVLAPNIDLDPRGTGERPPHIYMGAAAPPGWSLCLYHPRKREWKPDRLIAETIIPWAAEWLFFYEMWLIDGHWAGGGEHPIRGDRRCPTTKASFPDLPAASLRAAFLKAGRLTGTFVSSLSMAAVLGESFRRPSLPAWKPPGPQSPIVSIS